MRFISHSFTGYLKMICGGVSKARNTGITHATGDYIMFVDSDDYVDTTICKKLVSYEVFQITSNQCKEIFKDNFEIELLKTNFLKEVCVSIKKLIVLKGSYSFFEKFKLIRKYCNEYNFGDFQTKQWDDEPLVYRIFFFFLKKKKILLLFLITILSEK